MMNLSWQEIVHNVLVAVVPLALFYLAITTAMTLIGSVAIGAIVGILIAGTLTHWFFKYMWSRIDKAELDRRK